MAGYTPARVAVLGQGLPFAGARRVRADQVTAGDVSSSPRDRRSELLAKSFDEIDQHCAM
jgi:hypothetical protein